MHRISNIILLFLSGVEFNFHKYDANRINSRGVSYDYDSVMHYSSTAFANRRGVYTIVGKDGRTNLGQRYGLSQKDILQANKLYCGSAPQPATRPPIVTRPPTPPPPGKYISFKVFYKFLNLSFIQLFHYPSQFMLEFSHHHHHYYQCHLHNP